MLNTNHVPQQWGTQTNITMKTLITATLLFLPCLLVLNESDTVVPNIIGMAYILFLFGESRYTERGKAFVRKIEKIFGV